MALKFGSLKIVDKVQLPDPSEWPVVTDVPVEYEPIHNGQIGQFFHANGSVTSVKIQKTGAEEEKSNGVVPDRQ
jgi:hypothetical protein